MKLLQFIASEKKKLVGLVIIHSQIVIINYNLEELLRLVLLASSSGRDNKGSEHLLGNLLGKCLSFLHELGLLRFRDVLEGLVGRGVSDGFDLGI